VNVAELDCTEGNTGHQRTLKYWSQMSTVQRPLTKQEEMPLQEKNSGCPVIHSQFL